MQNFRCPACDVGVVEPRSAAGRRMTFRGVELEVPADLPIPTCGWCGEEWVGPGDAALIDGAMTCVLEREL